MKQKVLIVIVTMVLVITYCLIRTTDHDETPSETTTSTTTTNVEITTNTEETTSIEETTTSNETNSTQATTSKKEMTTVRTTESQTSTTKNKATSKDMYNVPNIDTSFKSWTSYQLVNRNSPQWNKVLCNSNAYTDGNGLRRVGEYYCVAMGSYYTRTLGDLFEIYTENGSFKIIICDFKDDAHTDASHQYTVSNGCMIEFYIDMSSLNSMVRQMGDASYAENRFRGRITNVVKIGNYFDS